MGLLQAKWIVGNGKPIERICQHTSQNLLRLIFLRQEEIDRPDWIARATAKFHKKHLAAYKLISLSPCNFAITASCIFRPEIGLLFDLTWYLYKSGIISCKNTLQHHCKVIAGKHLAVFSNTSQINATASLFPLLLDTLLQAIQVTSKKIACEDLAPQ